MLLDGLGAVGGHADEGDPVQRRYQPAQAVADHPVVVGEQHTNHQAGSSNVTVVPAPGAERTSSVPLA